MYVAILGTRKGVLKVSFDSTKLVNIEESFGGSTFSYAFQDERTKNIWACGDLGHWGQKLYVLKKGESNWVEKTVPKYPENEWIKEGKPAVMKYLWVMVAGAKSTPNHLYIGTEPGGLFESTDGGENFSLVKGLWDHPSRLKDWMGGGKDNPGIHSVIIDEKNPLKISVGISCAGFFRTIDGGKNWRAMNKGVTADFMPNPNIEVGQDTHLVTSSPSNTKVLWQQNHCGIFRSVDDGENWVKISQVNGPADFGFPITVDEKDENVAYVVPLAADQNRAPVNNALCVSKTEDGGKSWKELRKGLPQKHCYDVVLRHGMDIQGSALIMGSTTGNLYASIDAGENWFQLSSTLPPIYSVRFMKE